MTDIVIVKVKPGSRKGPLVEIGSNGELTISALPLIRALLADRAVDKEFERETGYRLTDNHLAMIVWVRPRVGDAPDPGEIRKFVQTLEAPSGAVGRPLLQMVDGSTIWIWMPVASTATGRTMTQLRARVEQSGRYRIAVGVPARGRPGFVHSHQQAQAAQRVAMAAAPTAERTVTCYRDRGVRAVSLVVNQLDVTKAWVREVLGDLAVDDENAAVLRETLAGVLADR
jgi:hypothetical protein